MTLHLVACWIFAAVAAVHAVWRRGGAASAPSFRAVVPIWFRYGVLFTISILVVTAFDQLSTIWDFRLKLGSRDLEAYREYFRQAVLVGFLIIFVMATSLVVRLLPNDLPNDSLER